MSNNSIEAQEPERDNMLVESDSGDKEVEYELAPDEDDTESEDQSTDDIEEK